MAVVMQVLEVHTYFSKPMRLCQNVIIVDLFTRNWIPQDS